MDEGRLIYSLTRDRHVIDPEGSRGGPEGARKSSLEVGGNTRDTTRPDNLASILDSYRQELEEFTNSTF